MHLSEQIGGEQINRRGANKQEGKRKNTLYIYILSKFLKKSKKSKIGKANTYKIGFANFRKLKFYEKHVFLLKKQYLTYYK